MKRLLVFLLIFLAGCAHHNTEDVSSATGLSSWSTGDRFTAAQANILKNAIDDNDTRLDTAEATLGAAFTDGSNLTGVDAATGDSATAFFDAGQIEHERGGLEADVSGYAGLVKISGGATSQAVEGTDYYGPAGTDVAVADGGTGSSNADAARTALYAQGEVATYQALRDYSTANLSSGDIMYVKSRATAGDGGDGHFRLITGAAGGTYSDDGGITLLPTGGDGSAGWVRVYSGAVNIKWYATGDGVTDDKTAIDVWLTKICADGGDGEVPGGTYSLSGAVTAALNASVRIKCSANAKFVAAAGYTANNDMFQITTGTGSGHSFEWVGGDFDATNQPNSGVGESNDVFSFNAENATYCHIELDRTTAGADWLNSGSDSHLFIGGPSNIKAYIWDCIGAVDAGIYISRNIDGDEGDSLVAGGNFSKCNVGVIVKRQFETAIIEANVTDCISGIGGSVADITGTALAAAGNGFVLRVNALRTERPVFLHAVDGAQVFVNARNLGVSIVGYDSTLAMGLYLSGATHVQGQVNAHGVNPALVVNNNFRGVYLDERAITSGTLQSTDNFVIVNCSSLGRSFAEANTSDRNTFIIQEQSMSVDPTITGTYTTYQRVNPTADGWELKASSISLGGLYGAEALRVVETASQVNWLQATGSTAAHANGPALSATGSDTNVPLTVTTKGTGAIYLGSAPGAETLRLSKVASQVNAVEATGSATGNAVALAARGSDTDINLQLTAKGAGKVITSRLNITGLSVYADNAAAIAGGLDTDDLYKTATGQVMIVYTP